jgi:hypothetical protein
VREERTVLVIGAILIATLASAGDPAPVTPSDKIFQSLGFTAEEREELRRGEIVSHAVKELSDKELAITMAVMVPAPVEDLLKYARSGKELEINRDILSYGVLGAGAAGDADATALQGAGFTPSEMGEVRALFEAEPGSKFNLSQAEAQRFADLRKRFPARDCEKHPQCVDDVVLNLRSILRDRLTAYRAHGLSGIQPYARGEGRESNPAEELRNATNAARFLAREYPQIFDAFLRYPSGDQSGIESRFMWLKQRIQDRPTFILAHRVLCVRDGVAFAAERQFYVGQSYNSLQILYGLVPAEGKTLVVYLNRTSTDQVAGFLSGTRHSMGRKIMEKEVRKHFEAVLASLPSRPSR